MLAVGFGRAAWLQPSADQPDLPSGPVSFQFVSSRAESHLYYPGAQVVAPFGGPERRGSEGAGAAFAGAVLASSDPPPRIYAWYRGWLLGHGWTTAEFTLADTQRSLEGYARGPREKFYVAMNDPASLQRSVGQAIPTDATVFEIRYLIAPAQ